MPEPSRPTPKAADRVLASASELFYREGARAVGVDEVVAHAETTKPSLYRAFGSKDQLIAAYLEGQAAAVWAGLEAAAVAHPDDPEAQLLAWIEGLGARALKKSDRGNALTNVAVEYPDPKQPGRAVAVRHKAELRERLREMTRAMEARKPKRLADSLLLLVEGVFASSQLFGSDGPADVARGAAEALIAAHAKDAARTVD